MEPVKDKLRGCQRQLVSPTGCGVMHSILTSVNTILCCLSHFLCDLGELDLEDLRGKPLVDVVVWVLEVTLDEARDPRLPDDDPELGLRKVSLEE